MDTNACAPHRIYVKVVSLFDAIGYMQPCSILWQDGRVFPIEEVLSFRPASAMHSSCHGDCYTVRIHGEEKRLFFERTDPRFTGCLGRWFVEKDVE